MRRALSSIIISTSLLSLSAFAAQGDVPSNPNIWAAVQDLQASQASQNAALTALQTTLASIQTTVNSLIPPAQGQVRQSPPLFFASAGGNTIACPVTNVASASREVNIEYVQGSTGAVVSTIGAVLEPGRTRMSAFVGFASDNYYCRFTVLDGTRSDIRASAIQFVNNAVAANAVVPAE